MLKKKIYVFVNEIFLFQIDISYMKLVTDEPVGQGLSCAVVIVMFEIVGGDSVTVSVSSLLSLQSAKICRGGNIIPESCELQKYIYLFTKFGYVGRKFKF